MGITHAFPLGMGSGEGLFARGGYIGQAGHILLVFEVFLRAGCASVGLDENGAEASIGAYSVSSSPEQTGAGGYEMPDENDESFSDCVKRVDPELYASLYES